MKKLFIFSAFAALAFAGCKKKETTISTLHNYSVPTILLPEGHFYSIPVGGVLSITDATAYDSFYNEVCTVVYDQSSLDNTIPGAYEVLAQAKNKYGMLATKKIYVAVTDIPETINLAGKYLRVATDDTVMVTMLANGLYQTSDVAANGASDITHVITGHFVQTSDVALSMPTQESKFGSFFGTNGVVNMIPGDTTLEYVIRNNAFAPVTRVFKKL
jgi:hypothetical protein